MTAVSRLARLLALLFALCSIPGLARAQNEIVPELPPEYGANSSLDWFPPEERAVDPRWSERALERYSEELAAGHHAVVLAKLADEFRAAPWPSHTGLQARFQTQLERVAHGFAEAQATQALADGLKTRDQRDRVLAALVERKIGVQSLLPELVRADATSTAMVLAFFAETDSRFDTYRFTPDDDHELLLPRELIRDLRLRAEAVRAVLQDFVEPLQRRAYDQIRRADRQWKNLLENGFSMYPWESLFNGWVLDIDAFDPPSHQWILVHPTVGFEMSSASLDQVQADQALAVDILGYVHYYGADYQHYLGGALTVTLRDDLGPGLGVTAHWEKGFSLGVAWHDVDGDDDYFDDDPYVTLSFDLFRFVESERPKYQEQWSKIQGMLASR